VCREAYRRIVGTSFARLKKIFDDYQLGICQYEKVERRRSIADKSQITKAWMSSYFGKIGEKMPHLDQVYMIHTSVYTHTYIRW
jgi:uncharacterized protein (DUF2225 family)